MFISFSNGHGSTFENSLDSGYSFASVSARCRKTAVGNVVAETGRDFGTTLRHEWAIFSSMPLTSEVRRSLAWTVCKAIGGRRKRGAANLYDMLIRGERWIVLMLFPIVRDVQRQRCSKRGSGDGQRLSLYDYGTTERSFHAVERWGSTLTCTVCTAADSEERQICTTCLFAESVGLWKRRRSYLMYAFSCMLFPIVIVEHTSVWEGVGGRGEIWRGIPQSNTKDQLPKPQTATVATAQRPK